jgi:hypothetical protein
MKPSLLLANTYSPQEIEKLAQFRSSLSDLLPSLAENQVRDSFLIKWLRARNLNLVEAEKMLRDSLKWRAEHGIDSLLDEKFPFELTTREPAAYCGVSKEGFATFIIPMGRYNARGCLEKWGPETLERFHFQNIENIENLMKIESEKRRTSKEKEEGGTGDVTQIIEIFDMDG